MASVTVDEGTRLVVSVDGSVVAVLAAGRHRLPGRWNRRTTTAVDVREQVLVLAGQEAAATDVPGVRFSVVVRSRVDDPVAHLQVSAAPVEELRLAAQLAARDWIAGRPLAEVLTRRADAAAVLTPAVADAARRLGTEVLEVSLRDVSVPGEIRRGLLETAIARLDSEARLERARGETAALRALANGTRALRDDPALLQLRTVQAAVERGGQVVLHVGAPAT